MFKHFSLLIMSPLVILRGITLILCSSVVIVSSKWASNNQGSSLKTTDDIRVIRKLYFNERRKGQQLSRTIAHLERRLSSLEKTTTPAEDIKRQKDHSQDILDKCSQLIENVQSLKSVGLYKYRDQDNLDEGLPRTNNAYQLQPSSNSEIFTRETKLTSKDQLFSKEISNHDRSSDLKRQSTLIKNMANTSKDLLQTDKYVSVTAVGTDVSSVTPNSVLRFPDVKSAFGLRNLQSFIQTGTFVCENLGLYLVAASLRICTTDSANDGDVVLLKNNHSVVNYHVEYSSDPTIKCLTISGSAVVALHLNDTLNIRTTSVQMEFYGSYSSLSIVQIR